MYGMDRDLSSLTDEELMKLYEETSTDLSNYDVFQQNIKILMNALYGSLANQYSRFYNPDIAEAVTTTGQLTVSWVEKNFNDILKKIVGKDKDYVVGIDTDSCMIDFSDIVERIVEKDPDISKPDIVTKLSQITDNSFEKFLVEVFAELRERMNFAKPKLHMKRECISSRGFYTRKKRYALLVYMNEDTVYSDPQAKVMGLESQRSDTPEYFREKLKEAYNIILSSDNDTLTTFVNRVEKEIMSLPPNDIASNSSVNGVKKYFVPGKRLDKSYKKGTPIHVRAAICYNYMIEKYKLTDKYEKIKPGDKIKYIYLKEPNPLYENVFGFPGNIPKEFDIEKYFDYKTQFKKFFLSPLHTVTECFGWSVDGIKPLI